MRDSTQFIITGAKTFRLSSRQVMTKKRYIERIDKIKTVGLGGNLQNIEKSLRKRYIPDEGMMFAQTDQSGAEALIVAYLCENGNYRKLFVNGIKPHVFVALHLFKDVWKKKSRELIPDVVCDIDGMINCDISDLKKFPGFIELEKIIKDSDNWSVNERYYYLSKQTCHSGNYDIKSNMFRMNVLEKSGGKIVLDSDESDRFLSTYREKLFPEIPDWHERLKFESKNGMVLRNLFGHPYIITSWEIADNEWKELYAWIPQSTVGMITNIAYSRLYNFVRAERLNWDVMINCHDSILGQSPVSEIMELAKKQKEYIEMSFVSPVDGVPFSMKSETSIGFNWSPFKDDNKNGLKEIKLSRTN